jgi:hypothetical protein
MANCQIGLSAVVEGYEAMHAIRKGQVRWVAKGDPIAQRQFIHAFLAPFVSGL